MKLEELAAEIRSPIVRCLWDHWRAIRGDRPVPVWRDIDAACISPALPLVSVWQVEPDASIRGRLCGADTHYYLGHTIKGKLLETVFPEAIAGEVRALILDVTRSQAIIHLRMEMPNRMGRTVDYERISLPFSFDGTLCDGVISVRVGDGIVPVQQYHRDTAWPRTAENRVQL